MTGDTCLHIALQHGHIALAKQMIESGSDPKVTNFCQENLESSWKAQKSEGQSGTKWEIGKEYDSQKIT